MPWTGVEFCFLHKNWRTDPNPLRDDEIQTAYEKWLRTYRHRRSDQFVVEFLKVGTTDLVSPEDTELIPLPEERLRVARTALLYSLRSAAEKIKVTKQQYQSFEKAEANGTITINSLKKAAEAIDCELVYAIRPKTKKPYSRVVWEKLAEPNLEQKSLFKQVAMFRPNLLNWYIARQGDDQEFRKKHGWSKRLPYFPRI